MFFTNVGFAFANENNPLNNNDNVNIQAIERWSLQVTPREVDRGQTVYLDGEAWGYSSLPAPLFADAKFEMLVDPYAISPVILSRSFLPFSDFTKRHHDKWGGTCWAYDSGVLKYRGDMYARLYAKTNSSSYGVHKVYWGSSYYIPDAWYSDAFNVKY